MKLSHIGLMIVAILAFTILPTSLEAQQKGSDERENVNRNKFRQLEQDLPTPNAYRNAAGAPGHEYWQQRADYDIELELDDDNQRIYGSETITYHNNSPDVLNYLWVQLDQNVRAKDSDSYLTKTMEISDSISFKDFSKLHLDFDGGFKIDHVKDGNDQDLNYVINKTMMRIDLPVPMQPNATFSFKVKWWYNINDRMKMGGRSGYEYFPEDDNYIYAIAQFYPRMAMYNEVYGWQNKQFLGRGEFTLVFGDYKVSITAPADHVITATGELQNPDDVLTNEQMSRFRKAKTSDEPVLIITENEARRNESSRSKSKKTWVFHAENVRDFGWASSRKFIWDAMGVTFGERTVLAMSLYPKEGNPLWEQYSTRTVAHTLRIFSRHTFDYPYPVAISVHTKKIGMEYPMICFNFGRPEKDGTYSERTKYRMIGVIIHEVGHNYFPMIVNSDERQWTWMDEGLNSFVQYLTEKEWDRDYPSRRGPSYKITDYMKGDKKRLSPIMSNSETIHQFGNNSYAKPAAALNILRETVLGRELFDFAFKEYSQRWMFKHPTPADFFRTMEDASGVDLDWFWRGWFYTTDHVDMSIDAVNWFKVDTRNPDQEKPLARIEDERTANFITDLRNKEDIPETVVEKDPATRDFYNEYDEYNVNNADRMDFQKYNSKLAGEDRQLLSKKYNYYEVRFSNIGGLVMPIILEIEYDDGSKELMHIPAEIWRYNNNEVRKVLVNEKEIRSIALDPFLETADTDMSNNYWPPRPQPTRFKLFKEKKEKENKMQREKRAKKISPKDIEARLRKE